MHKNIKCIRFKNKVRYQTATAIRRGLIVRKPCKCGNEKSEVHHRDYSNPCDIEFLCRRCHEDAHKKKSPEPRPVRDWMEKNGITSFSLAVAVKVSTGAVSKWRQNISYPFPRAERRVHLLCERRGWTPFPARLPV